MSLTLHFAPHVNTLRTTHAWAGRKRLLALAAQKFVSDIAADAYQHARIRTNASGGRARANQGPGSSRVSSISPLAHHVVPAATHHNTLCMMILQLVVCFND